MNVNIGEPEQVIMQGMAMGVVCDAKCGSLDSAYNNILKLNTRKKIILPVDENSVLFVA